MPSYDNNTTKPVTLILLVPENYRLYRDQFLELWPQRKETVLHDLETYIDNPNGIRRYVVFVGDDVAGLTGFYPYHNDIGLSWHGLFDEFRGMGYSEIVFWKMIRQAIRGMPWSRRVVEALPSDRVDQLHKHFTQLGFTCTGKKVVRDDLPNDVEWLEYVMSLPVFRG